MSDQRLAPSGFRPQAAAADSARRNIVSSPFLIPPVTKSSVSDGSEEEVSIMFPAPDSNQRVASSKIGGSNLSIRPPQNSSAGSLSVPAPPSGPTLLPKSASAAARARSKVALKPGHSPMDWVKLSNSGTNLRGIDSSLPIAVSAEELQKHNSLDDMWVAIEGKVYNVTPYVPFHPGGEKILKPVAGKDGTRLFMKTHSWVSYENILQNTLVGIYRP